MLDTKTYIVHFPWGVELHKAPDPITALHMAVPGDAPVVRTNGLALKGDAGVTTPLFTTTP